MRPQRATPLEHTAVDVAIDRVGAAPDVPVLPMASTDLVAGDLRLGVDGVRARRRPRIPHPPAKKEMRIILDSVPGFSYEVMVVVMSHSPSALAVAQLQAPFSSPDRFRGLLVALIVLTLATLALAVAVGPVTIAVPDVLRVLTAHLTGGQHDLSPALDQIVWEVRLPRVLLAAAAGAGLALAGAVIQAVVRNPLGDPYLIGIVPGAGLGAVTVIVLGTSAAAGLSLTAAAFVGAIGAFALTFGLARQAGGWGTTRLILSGVAVGYLFSSMTFFLQTQASPTELKRVLFWSLGSLSGAEWGDLPILAVITALGTAWLLLSARRLNALVAGRDLAQSLGVEVAHFQIQLMGAAALVTAAVVSVVGGIGFVGLVIPHVARLLVGADHRRVLLLCPPLGAVMLIAADLLARMVLQPTEVPVGIVTAAAGAPFFLWLLSRSGRVASVGSSA